MSLTRSSASSAMTHRTQAILYTYMCIIYIHSLPQTVLSSQYWNKRTCLYSIVFIIFTNSLWGVAEQASVGPRGIDGSPNASRHNLGRKLWHKKPMLIMAMHTAVLSQRFFAGLVQAANKLTMLQSVAATFRWELVAVTINPEHAYLALSNSIRLDFKLFDFV